MFELMPFFPTRRNDMLNIFDPFRELDDIERAFFGSAKHTFATDIRDNGDRYTLETDLPGFSKDDIKIDIADGTMTVSAERHSDAEDKDKKGNYVRIERSYGKYSRSYDLSEVDAEKITASFDNGVLSIELPKLEKKLPEKRRLEIA